MCNKEMIATQHRAPTVTLIQTKCFGPSQIGCCNLENMQTKKLICSFCEIKKNCEISLQEPWAMLVALEDVGYDFYRSPSSAGAMST